MGVGKVKEEIWKDVVGYEGIYSVSNLGRVRSHDRISVFICRGREQTAVVKGRLMALTSDSSGYKVVSLSVNGRRKVVKVHRIVATAFIDNPENKEEVNHLNGIKDDNRVENLEWATRCENDKHGRSIGLIGTIGGENYNAKLTEIDVRIIMNMIKCGAPLEYLADEFGVQKPAIWKIQHGYKWSHVTGIQKH